MPSKTLKKKSSSKCGPPTKIKNLLDAFAKYWWEKLDKDVWHSNGQEGYYFSDRRHNKKPCYMSETHLHIWKMTETGNKINVFWAKKINNVHISAGNTTLDKGKVAKWLSSSIKEMFDVRNNILELSKAAKKSQKSQ
jgi:hypothetical protein